MYLLCHRVIDGLGDLVHETSQVLITSVSVVNIERFVDHVTESSGADQLV